jgi:hypothetical protein
MNLDRKGTNSAVRSATPPLGVGESRKGEDGGYGGALHDEGGQLTSGMVGRETQGEPESAAERKQYTPSLGWMQYPMRRERQRRSTAMVKIPYGGSAELINT